jgi:hypothetical protein
MSAQCSGDVLHRAGDVVQVAQVQTGFVQGEFRAEAIAQGCAGVVVDLVDQRDAVRGDQGGAVCCGPLVVSGGG